MDDASDVKSIRSEEVTGQPDKRPVPPTLTFLAGLVIGMQVEGARKLGASARADLEPSIGIVAGTVLEWLVFLAWIMFVTCFIGWFFRLGLVRAAFEEVERRSANKTTSKDGRQ